MGNVVARPPPASWVVIITIIISRTVDIGRQSCHAVQGGDDEPAQHGAAPGSVKERIDVVEERPPRLTEFRRHTADSRHAGH
jgi:hypothetical protein